MQVALVAVLASLVNLIHFKDRDISAGRTVPLGDGDVLLAMEFTRLLTGSAKARNPRSYHWSAPLQWRSHDHERHWSGALQ